jgi:hypothetical protein
MATTEGKVQQVTIVPQSGTESFACVLIGPDLDDAETFVIVRRNTDSGHRGAFKNSMVDACVAARASGTTVVVNHNDGDAEILSMSFGD